MNFNLSRQFFAFSLDKLKRDLYFDSNARSGDARNVMWSVHFHRPLVWNGFRVNTFTCCLCVCVCIKLGSSFSFFVIRAVISATVDNIHQLLELVLGEKEQAARNVRIIQHAQRARKKKKGHVKGVVL